MAMPADGWRGDRAKPSPQTAAFGMWQDDGKWTSILSAAGFWAIRIWRGRPTARVVPIAQRSWFRYRLEGKANAEAAMTRIAEKCGRLTGVKEEGSQQITNEGGGKNAKGCTGRRATEP